MTLDTGTGIVVHIAPAFGEDDYGVQKKMLEADDPDLPLFCAVKTDGTFIDGTGH